MLTRFVLCGVLIAAVSIGAATPAWAQEDLPPRTSLMGGYSFMIDRSWQQNLPYGLVAALAHRFNETASIVVEGSGQRGKYGATDFNIDRWALLGGIKLQSTGGGEALLPFIQALGGWSRQAGDVGIVNGWIVQGGGGIDLRFRDRLYIRAFADYRLMRELGNFSNQYRVGGGVVWALRR